MNPAAQASWRNVGRPGQPPPQVLSPLGAVAAAMSPGSWQQVTFSGIAANMLATFHISTDTVSGSMINDSYYFAWDPFNKRIVYVGQDHYNISPPSHIPGNTQRHCWFDDASGLFVVGTNDTTVKDDTQTPEHGFGHSAVNPHNGHVFIYTGYNHDNAHVPLWECNPGVSAAFSLAATASSIDAQVSIACCWWDGAFTGRTLGSQGAFMLFNSGACAGVGTGELLIYDPTVPGFLTTITGFTGSEYTSDDNCVMAYSKVKNCALFGGGHSNIGVTPNNVVCYRLNSDGTVTRMPNCPASSGMGAHNGVIAADPVGGNFLLFNDTEVWELNPTGSGTWTQQTGGKAMPAGFQGHYAVPGSLSVDASGGAPTTVTDYGVIAHTIMPHQSTQSMWLYKHG